jgi:hypothetical protein
MSKIATLNYIFKVEFKSCASESWVRPTEYSEPNDQRKSPWQIAGEIAAGEMESDVSQRGVRVQFLGLRKPDDVCPITALSPFTLTLTRDQ